MLVSTFPRCVRGATTAATTAAARAHLLRAALLRTSSLSDSSFSKFSTSELKRMLQDRGVDFRDCLEKQDLISKLEDALRLGKVATPRSSHEHLTDMEKRVVNLFKSCSKSVAFIQTMVSSSSPLSLRSMEVPAGTGSGFVWDEHGHVVTNYHVIFPPQMQHRPPQTIKVTLQSSRHTFDARVVGVEPEKDLCVLRLTGVSRDQMHPVAVGSSSDVLVGQMVLAIGNPFGLDYTLTTGVVSALGREVMGVGGRPIKGCVQTDAAINPGNSGGPLLDSSGRLIGVNTMIYSQSGMSGGIGFAIPVDTVRRVVTQLIRFGKVIRPSLGVQVADDQTTRSLSSANDIDIKGVLIFEVVPGSPADKAGLQGTKRGPVGQLILGDVITAVDGVSVMQVEDLLSAVEEKTVGSTVTLTVTRNGVGRTDQISVGLTERPSR